MGDKILVNDIECERLVLGTLLSYRNAFADNADILSADVFYYPKHQTIYRAMAEIVAGGDTINPVTLNAYTQKTPGAGIEFEYLAECCEMVATDVTLRSHCLRLADLYHRRKMWLIGCELIKAGTTEYNETDEIKCNAIESLQAIDEAPQASIITAREALASLQTIVSDNLSGNRRNGAATGFEYLDNKGGLQMSDLVVIAAEFSQGKTSLALDMCVNAAMAGFAAAFYSTEMQSYQLAARMLSRTSGLSSRAILQNPLTDKEIVIFDAEVARMANLPVFFDDTSTLSVERIIASIRTMARKRGVKLAFIDYLQVLQTNEKSLSRTEEQFFGLAARKFKNLAKELNICIVLISQIARCKDTTEPTLSRIRGSGQIAEAADVVMLIYRPETYKKRYNGEHSNVDPHNTALIKIAKGRNIGTGDFICGYDAPATHFYDLSSVPTLNGGQQADDDSPF